jgi:hypothetical protein
MQRRTWDESVHMGPLAVGDLVERIDEVGGMTHLFEVGQRAIVTRVGSPHGLVHFDNGAILYPMRVKKVEERKIKGDDDEDCI